jgi:beta-lactamase regulating signal transducer with metallopeptidase domain
MHKLEGRLSVLFVTLLIRTFWLVTSMSLVLEIMPVLFILSSKENEAQNVTTTVSVSVYMSAIHFQFASSHENHYEVHVITKPCCVVDS